MTEVKFFPSSRQCFVWHTERPFINRIRTSPVFTFMDCRWYFKLMYHLQSPNSFDIYIVSKDVVKAYPSFFVILYMKNTNGKSRDIFRRVKSASYTTDPIWRIYTEDLFNTWFSFKEESTEFIFTFVFQETTLCFKQAEDKSVQVSFDTAAGWQSILDTRRCSEISPSTSLDLPFSLESLSLDFENLLDKNVSPDVQLQSGDRTIPAHKAVLAARSEVFAAMFRHEMSESSSGVIDIKDISTPALDVFLRYVYSGKIADNLSEEMISSLYAVSDKYAVYALKKICSNFMIRNVNDENYLTLLTLADTHSDQEFKDAVASFITKDDKLLKSEAWLKYATEKPLVANEIYGKYFQK